MLKYTTTTKVVAPSVEQKWHLLDAQEFVVGRLATRAAELLIGKNKVSYAPLRDMGDAVVIINAPAISISGKKNVNKQYKNYSGYPGGLNLTSYEKMSKEKPEEIIRKAIMGMLPKNKLRDKRIQNLYIFKGSEHPFSHKFTA